MVPLHWTGAEKRIAREVFETACEAEKRELLETFKRRAAQMGSSDDLWQLAEDIERARRDFDRKYDYRYSQLPFVFGQLVREGRLAVVESIKLDSPKTKQLADKFKAMNLKSVLLISEEVDENLYLASRNLPNVLVVEPRYADPVSLVHYKKVIVTKGAIDKLKEMYA